MTRTAPAFAFIADAQGGITLSGTGSGVLGDSHYYVNDKPMTEALAKCLTRETADLLDVAVAVYLADRLARRSSRPNPYEHHWQRQMRVTIPVRDLARWRQPEIVDSLKRALDFLTEDDWSFAFVQRALERGRVSEQVQYLLPSDVEPPVTVGLFSGGLDSLAGLARDLEQNRPNSVVLVSANTTGRVLPVQRGLVSELRSRSGSDGGKIMWTVGQFGFRRRKTREYEREERTQRTRGFAFTVFGAVAAQLAEADSLRLYENGVGAINLPYTGWQIGAQSTRAMHPTAISLLQELIRRATGRELRLELANLDQTKGQLCKALARSAFGDLATRTISCDGFPLRKPGPKQCGCCTSCLLRRQALLVAGIPDDERGECGYQFDIYKRYGTLSEKKKLPAQVMFDQARRIRRSAGSWAQLVREFPALLELPETVDASAQGAIAAMYARYGEEFAVFEAAVMAGAGARRRFA